VALEPFVEHAVPLGDVADAVGEQRISDVVLRGERAVTVHAVWGDAE
jgi:hypothetical protein